MINIRISDYSPILKNITIDGEFEAFLKNEYNIQEGESFELASLYNRFFQDTQDYIDSRSNLDIYCIYGTKKDSKPQIIKKQNDVFWTQGYVGVIEYKGVTINIESRFDTEESQQFLMHVFNKAFNVKGNIFKDMNVSGKLEHKWDVLLTIIFVKQLHDAMKKGLFRQYKEFKYNDSNVRGKIDVTRHIKHNMFPNGKIAYTTREYSINNDINVMLLKAYQCLDKKYHQLLQSLISKDDVIKKALVLLESEIYDWKEISDKQILKMVNKKIVQSTYKAYEPLRKTSIAILKRLGINTFIQSQGSVSGVLINISKLWEEYLYNTIFKKLYNTNKPYRQVSSEAVDGHRKMEPDFLWEEKSAVFDAKYKRAWGETLRRDEANTSNKEWDDNVRDDVFQVLAYMLAFNCKYGATIFPVQGYDIKDIKRCMIKSPISKNCADRFFFRIPFVIPQNIEGRSFREQITLIENTIYKELLELK